MHGVTMKFFVKPNFFFGGGGRYSAHLHLESILCETISYTLPPTYPQRERS